MSALQKLAGAVGIAMIATALFLPGRGSSETAFLGGLTNLSKGTIRAAEGQN